MFIVNLVKYLFLGLVQGFTEPIPVSSSGHLRIFKEILNDKIFNDLSLEIFLNFGSLIAIVIFFWKDIVEIINDFCKFIKSKEKRYKANFKYALMIAVGTLPAAIIGLLFNDAIEKVLGNIKFVGVALLVTAIFLYIIKDFKGKKDDEKITYKDALIVGLFQAVALFPGISRSGATLVGAMLLGIKRKSAFKFSFMLYIPISLATMILGVKNFLSSNITVEIIAYYLIGMVAAFVMTLFATKWFNKIINKGKLIYFVIYCIIIGTSVILFL
jgi:undecaprenyl-diphosphatase UppP